MSTCLYYKICDFLKFRLIPACFYVYMVIYMYIYLYMNANQCEIQHSPMFYSRAALKFSNCKKDAIVVSVSQVAMLKLVLSVLRYHSLAGLCGCTGLWGTKSVQGIKSGHLLTSKCLSCCAFFLVSPHSIFMEHLLMSFALSYINSLKLSPVLIEQALATQDFANAWKLNVHLKHLGSMFCQMKVVESAWDFTAALISWYTSETLRSQEHNLL